MADILANPGKVIAPVSGDGKCLRFSDDVVDGKSSKTPNENESALPVQRKSPMVAGLFSGANMSGCTFNINFLTNNN